MIKTIIKVLIIALISLNINITFADYTRSINDDMIIYNIDEKLKSYIDKSKNPEFTRKRLLKKIEKLLDKNKDELNKIFDYPRKKEFESFKEYALIQIHDFLTYGDIFIGVNKDPSYAQVLANDYIRIIVTNSSFTLNNDKLFWTRKDGYIFNYIEFFKINPEEKTEDYIINTIKCDIKTNTQEYINFTENKAYYTEGCSYSNNGVSYFERISPTTLIYISAGQDYAGIDFSSMEIKK